MKHGHGLRVTLCHSCIGVVVGARVWIEQIVIVIALLDHPNDDEDNDVQEVLLDEQTAYRCANARSVQSSVTVDGRVDGHNNIE